MMIHIKIREKFKILLIDGEKIDIFKKLSVCDQNMDFKVVMHQKIQN